MIFMNLISYSDFAKVKICSWNNSLNAEENNTLKKPSIVLTIDFGEKIGIKKKLCAINLS